MTETIIDVIFSTTFTDILTTSILIVFGILMLERAYKYNRKSNYFKDIPVSKIRSIALGQVKLNGKSKECNGLYSQPFKNGSCLFGYWKIERESKENESGRWKTIDSGKIGSSFLLDDGSGTVLIDAESNPDIQLKRDNKWIDDLLLRNTIYKMKKSPNYSKEEIKRFESQNNIPKTENKKRYTQKCVAEGDEILVLGKAEKNNNVSDDDASDHSEIMITKDYGKDEFIISDKDEKDLHTKYKRKFYLYTATGFSSIIIGFFNFLM